VPDHARKAATALGNLVWYADRLAGGCSDTDATA
jgi:hypothetical protein